MSHSEIAKKIAIEVRYSDEKNMIGIDRMRLSQQIELAISQAVAQEREACRKAVCKYCDSGRPLIGDTHTWQVLTSKNKKGEFIYNPVQEECLATKILHRSNTEDKH